MWMLLTYCMFRSDDFITYDALILIFCSFVLHCPPAPDLGLVLELSGLYNIAEAKLQHSHYSIT